MSEPAITVYIPCRHYGRFLEQAVRSVLAQSRTDWELIIVDDGSQDETAAAAARFAAEQPGRIRVVRHEPARGLRASANTALGLARGKYILRLDADDYMDDQALLVLAAYLDSHSEIALVYPNYVYMDENGFLLGIEDRKRIGPEAQLLDLPAHGAGTMIRTEVLRQLGGYDERHALQDGYELWLKVLPRHGIGNVSTPLFYYRQHPASQSSNEARLLATRRRIKRERVDERQEARSLTQVAIIPAKNTYAWLPDVVLREVAGMPLIDYTLEATQQSGLFQKILVTTDDPRVVEHCRRAPGVSAVLRPSELSGERVMESEVALHAARHLEEREAVRADILVLLSVHSPLRTAAHIQEAVNTLILYEADSVLSVVEDLGLHYVHGRHGLTPLNPAMHRQIRVEREGLYESNGAIRALWRKTLTPQDISGQRVAHIVMSKEESIQIKSPSDLWLLEQMLRRRNAKQTVLEAPE